MPTFTAIALDRFLEPGASKAVAKRASVPIPKPGSGTSARLEERMRGSDGPKRDANANNSSTAQKKCHFAQISPALYATPEATPLPDSPSSFPPSPYIINHKRRGPRLLKSFSQDSVPSGSPQQGSGEVENVVENEKEKEVCDSATNVAVPATFTISSPSEEEERVDIPVAGGTAALGAEDLVRFAGAYPERDLAESSSYYDPQESLSYASYTDGEDNAGAERSHYNATVPEFYDACEDISSEGGAQTSLSDVEADMREIRLTDSTILMEIEKRKQAEEALNNMRSQWRRIVQHLSVVGLTVPSDLSVLAEANESHTDIGEELGQQVYLARVVSESVGRGAAKAEMEIEMEAQIESKNLEIARLLDRLHYYEAVNWEMSQRNQEAIELARRVRQRKKRRQRWYWGMVATAITLGTGALAWSYLATEKGSSTGTSSSHSQVPEEN